MNIFLHSPLFVDPQPLTYFPTKHTQLKAALKEGAVTKKDVEELEKMMGVDVKELVKMMGSGKVDKSKLDELGADVSDLLEVFKEMAKIKG